MEWVLRVAACTLPLLTLHKYTAMLIHLPANSPSVTTCL